MSEVTLSFTVPDEVRATFDHELALAVEAMGPMIEWLRRNGGQACLFRGLA